MLGALHPGRLEAVSEFYSTDSRDGEYGVGDKRFDRIEERIAEPCRDTVDPALYNSSQRIPLAGSYGEEIRPFFPVLFAAYLFQSG